jgi:hypothetical protein
MIGWLGYEFGQVLDYKGRSSRNLIWFGILYYFSTSFLKRAEITADKNAAELGLIDELMVSKESGRDSRYFPMCYVNKLNVFYPSIQDVRRWAGRSDLAS